MARTSSASRLSEKDVKPTRSTNNTDTRRRSVSGSCGSPAAVDEGDAASETNGEPHSPQNLASAALAAPHAAHPIESRAPHSLQNLRPGSLPTPHATHLMTPPWRPLADRHD